MESLVATCKQGAVSGMETFLKTFSFVPDDKLNWAPVASAKTPLQIAAHTACTAGVFAQLYRDGKFPPIEMGKLVAEDLPVLILDHPPLTALSGFFSKPLDGIIGYTFWAHYKLTIDYQARKMTWLCVRKNATL